MQENNLFNNRLAISQFSGRQFVQIRLVKLLSFFFFLSLYFLEFHSVSSAFDLSIQLEQISLFTLFWCLTYLWKCVSFFFVKVVYYLFFFPPMLMFPNLLLNAFLFQSLEDLRFNRTAFFFPLCHAASLTICSKVFQK